MEQSTLHNDEAFLSLYVVESFAIVTPADYDHTLYIQKWYARHKKRLGFLVLDPEIIDDYGNQKSDKLNPNTAYQVLLYEFPEKFSRKELEVFVAREKLLFVGFKGLCLIWENQRVLSRSLPFGIMKKKWKRIMALSLESGIISGAETAVSLERGILGGWNFREYYITEGRDSDDEPCYFNLVSLMGNLQKKTVFVFFKEL